MADQRRTQTNASYPAGASSKEKGVNSVIGKEWYFWTNYGGSFLGPGMTNPILTTSAEEGSKFRIVAAISGHTYSKGTIVAKVAIECTGSYGEKTYISCRRKCFITNSCLAEYRDTIGDFETFTMSYCEIDNSFIFQSHNNYFLHFNETFHTAAFKPCNEREDGFPFKGRWDLLDSDETNRIGKKSARSSIPLQTIISPLKAVKGLFSM